MCISIRSIFPQKSDYLESQGWDAFWILNGFWILGLLILSRALDLGRGLSIQIIFFGLLLLWGGHIFSPIITTWMNPAFRTNMLRQWKRYILLPAATLVLPCILFVLGLKLLKTSEGSPLIASTELVALVLYTFILWNTWHFSAQHFGVLSIYRRRSSLNEPAIRIRDRRFTVIMTCVLLPLAWYTQSQRLGPLYEYLPTPHARGSLAWIVITASAAITLYMLFEEFRERRGISPRALYMVTIGFQPVFASISYFTYNFALFTMSHWIIAIALSSRILANQGAGESTSTWERYRWYLGIYFGFILLSVPIYLFFYSADVMGPVASDARFVITSVFQRDGASSLSGLTGTTAMAILAGLYFGITFVHFQYDRFQYSFHDENVRKTMAPLLFRRLAATKGQPH